MPAQDIRLALAAFIFQPKIERLPCRKLRDGHHEVAPCISDKTLDGAFIVALAGTAKTVTDHIMRQHRTEPLCSIAGAVRLDFGHKATVIVVKDGARHRTEKGKGMHMPVKPSLGVGRRVRANIARIAVWQVKGKEVRLLLNTANDNQGFAKVGLTMPRRMAQRDKHLP